MCFAILNGCATLSAASVRSRASILKRQVARTLRCRVGFMGCEDPSLNGGLRSCWRGWASIRRPIGLHALIPGMQRRLDVAMGLVHHPSVLFMDEPTTGLDPEARADMWKEIARLAREEGITILLTTHYLEEADRLAQRLAIRS